MEENWHSIRYKNKDAFPDGAIEAEAHVDAASLWFSGHFPNEPILPGIAILSMVTDVLRQCAQARGKSIRVSGIRRVRFRLPVRPGQSLSIAVSWPDGNEPDACHFKVAVNGEAACSGIVELSLSKEDCGCLQG